MAGYELKPRQLPTELKQQNDPLGLAPRVLLYTIQPPNQPAKSPVPLATLSATAAACDAMDACVMFTSDGYLVGAYRPVRDVTDLPQMLQVERRLGPWQWRPMRYCAGSCCGTWLSTSFDAKSLDVPATKAQAQAGRAVNAPASTAPPGGGAESDVPRLYGVDGLGEDCAAMRAGQVSSSTCPTHCQVACCALEDADRSGYVQMLRHRFWQCSELTCAEASCGFQFGPAVVPFAGSSYTRITAVYAAQKSSKQPAQPSKAAATRRSGGSGVCTGSLC